MPYIRKNTAAQNAALARLSSFLDTSTPQLVYFLHQMFQDQQTAITYKELREAWLDGYEQEIRQWQEDYARFVEDRLSPMWEIAMWNGAQQYINRLKERGILVYDDSDQDVRSWIQMHTAEFVTNIGEGTRQAIRSIVMHGQNEGWTADQMARAIRPCIGLTQPQAMANLRYQQNIYENLLENHPRMRKDVAARKAQEAALKYAAKQHRLRASTIADTELAYAYNMGAHESVRQAMKQGLMGPCEKVWSTAADPRVCEKCRALAGKRIGFDEGFSDGKRSSTGSTIVPPAHPRCRCVVEYVEISAPVIKPFNSNEKPPSKMTIEDVTMEYIQKATPGKGQIVYAEGYRKSSHEHEVEIAHWLHDTFGGDITLLNEKNEPNKKTPDYLWRGKSWDLKELSTEKAADSAIRHGLKQIADNQGGLILDYKTENFDLKKLVATIEDRLNRGFEGSVDIMLSQKLRFLFVKRYTKR